MSSVSNLSPSFVVSLEIIVVVRRRPNVQLWQLRVAVWDLLAWLPFDPASKPGSGAATGLSGPACWHSVFGDELFTELVTAVLQSPADLVMTVPKIVNKQ